MNKILNIFTTKKFVPRFVNKISLETFINFLIYFYVASFFYNEPLPDGHSLSYYSAILILIGKIVKIIKNEEKLLIDNNVIYVILLFYLYIIVSEFFINNGDLKDITITLGLNILIFFIIFHEISKKIQLLKNIKSILSIGGLFISFLISFDFFTETSSNGRKYVFDFNHNELSWLLTSSLIIFYSEFLSLKKKLSFHNFKNYFVIFLIVSCIMIINALVLIGTRSVLLFLLIIFLLFFTFSRLKKNNFNQNIFFIMINFAFLLFKFYLYSPIHSRTINEFSIRLSKESSRVEYDESIDLRQEILSDGINKIVNDLTPFGNAMNNINYHNSIIGLIVDYGLISLVFIIIIIILITLKCFSVFKKVNYTKIFFVTTFLLWLSAILNLADVRLLKFWWLLFAIFLVKIYSKTKSF